MRHSTKYVPVKYENQLARFPNAGPRPSIKGMKDRFWGEDAYCVKCGQYVYKVDRNTWERF